MLDLTALSCFFFPSFAEPLQDESCAELARLVPSDVTYVENGRVQQQRIDRTVLSQKPTFMSLSITLHETGDGFFGADGIRQEF